jgi:O-antigen ligase
LLVHNGLGVYASWLLLAVVLNLAVWLKYSLGIDELLTGTVCLSIFALFIVSHFICENFIYKVYMLWLVTPWFVYLFALISIVQGNWRDEKPIRNNIFTIALLGISVVFAAIKVLSVLVDEIRSKDSQNRRLEAQYTPVQITQNE